VPPVSFQKPVALPAQNCLSRDACHYNFQNDTRFHRLYSKPIGRSTALKFDHTNVPKGIQTNKYSPDKLCVVRYLDDQKDRRFSSLSNNFLGPALVVAKLYQCRWHVEVFFTWIKRHLRMSVLYGTSTNKAKTQILRAVSVLPPILKRQLRLDELSFYIILQVLSRTLFEKSSITTGGYGSTIQYYWRA
jgi:hypothetical protein